MCWSVDLFLSPDVTFINHLSIIVDIPCSLPTLSSRLFIKKKCVKKGKTKKTREVATLTENDSSVLGLSPKIIKLLNSHNSPFTRSNLSPLSLVYIFGCSSPPTKPVYPRRVDLSVVSLSLSSQRHSYISILFRSRFSSS